MNEEEEAWDVGLGDRLVWGLKVVLLAGIILAGLALFIWVSGLYPP